MRLTAFSSATPCHCRGSCCKGAELPLAAQVSYDRLRQSDTEPGNWLTYSGNYSAHRYSRLDQITAGERRASAAGLGLPDQHD